MRLGPWLSACLRGRIGPDDMAEAVRGPDPRHLVEWHGSIHELIELPKLVGPGSAVRVCLVAPGDLGVLTGPASFNAEALGAGGALQAGNGVALVPEYDARTLIWRRRDCLAWQHLDQREASRDLRRELTLAASAVADSGLAREVPEIPDLLLNAEHRPSPPLPPGFDSERMALLDRALLALEMVALAPHHPALASLSRAARRAASAVCSDSLDPS